jgi:hypothetical protein
MISSNSFATTLGCKLNVNRSNWVNLEVIQPSMGAPNELTHFNGHEIGASYSPGMGGETQDFLFIRLDAATMSIGSPSKSGYYQLLLEDGTEIQCYFLEKK